MNKRLLLAAFLSLMAGFGFAKQTPLGLMSDSRIKVVTYDPDNVVEIKTSFGVATTLVLEKDEYVTEDGGMGKKAGWEIVSKPHSNFIIIKPKLTDNETNLNFQTNKNRIYSLALKASDNPQRATFMVRFKYDNRLKNSPFASRRKAYQVIENFSAPRTINTCYSFAGDATIAPIKAQDNGTFTLLKFKKGAPIPAILAVDPSTRKESLVNFRVQGGFVVVEGVYIQMTLRYGSHVTCLFNDRAIQALYGTKISTKKRIVYAKKPAANTRDSRTK